MKNWKIILPWNIPFSSKVLWVLVRKAKEEKGAMFKGDTISALPLTYQLSREHALGWTVEETALSPAAAADSNHLLGECHKHTTMPIVVYADSFSFHSTYLKTHSCPFQRTEDWNAAVSLPYNPILPSTLNWSCYLSEFTKKYFIQRQIAWKTQGTLSSGQHFSCD